MTEQHTPRPAPRPAPRTAPRDHLLAISFHLTRCEPAASACELKNACARYLAPIMRNGSVEDFSVEAGPRCDVFVTVADAKEFGVLQSSTTTKE